jgi:gamma-glutamyltranspeptidase/glutathione hydrolase
MAEQFPLATWGWNSTHTVHLLAQAERLAYADRAAWLGDGDVVDVPVQALLSAQYLEERLRLLDTFQATPSEAVSAGNPLPAESTETTHFSIVDPFGNAIAITTTLNGSYGSGVVVHGAGFLLNNEMDDFSSKPGTPNLYGLVGSEANAIASGKRMLSSMSPTIIEQEGRLFMVVGTPGGSTIPTSVLQVFLNVALHGFTMQEAVNAGRFHHQWLPDVLYFEDTALDSITIAQLLERGHTLQQRGDIGAVDAILVLPDGRLEGAADFRMDDAAAGY